MTEIDTGAVTGDGSTTSPDAALESSVETELSLTPLDMPIDGVPPVVTSERALLEAARAIAAGDGSVALDAERASGYRYGQRAYLVQIRRDGSGTWLIDPIACPDLTPINEAIGGAEWILHAATQDLPCLAEIGLTPRQLFDTELAGRLLGLPRVGLAAVVEHYLQLTLAKEHSAVDWSTRPLPEPWLRYAALDVEVLTDLRNLMGVDLARQGKAEWARQEFESLLSFTGPPPRVDPWRRTSGMHRVRHRRTAAAVRELWQVRDLIAQERDISPGRVLPDGVLVEIGTLAPSTAADLPDTHRSVRRYQRQWLDAVRRAQALPESELPPMTLRSDGPPPQRAWAERDALAAARLTTTREALIAFAEEHTIPVENVLSPDPLRRVIWTPPQDHSAQGFAGALAQLGARRWQTDIVAPMIAAAFEAHPDE
ncbi:MAG TPA: HRDC domain-containing protein [Pedococcus sp.]|jgi:ribonuclease D|nr:HRDC domain-containing protein [Pedococcus sp.]